VIGELTHPGRRVYLWAIVFSGHPVTVASLGSCRICRCGCTALIHGAIHRGTNGCIGCVRHS